MADTMLVNLIGEWVETGVPGSGRLVRGTVARQFKNGKVRVRALYAVCDNGTRLEPIAPATFTVEWKRCEISRSPF